MYATRIAEGDMLAAVFSAEREAASGAGRRGTRGAPRDRRGAGVASALGRRSSPESSRDGELMRTLTLMAGSPCNSQCLHSLCIVVHGDREDAQGAQPGKRPSRDEHAAKFYSLASRTNVNPGTIARSAAGSSPRTTDR